VLQIQAKRDSRTSREGNDIWLCMILHQERSPASAEGNRMMAKVTESGTGQRDLLQTSLASTEDIGMLAGAAASGAVSTRDDAGRSRSPRFTLYCDGLAALY
jgi:hypothetical protein